MTDSVRCTADSLNTFTCEVQLEAELESLTCEAAEPDPTPPPPPPPSPPSAASPAVSMLVSSFVSKTELRAPSPPLISGAALLKCAPSELSIVVAATAGKIPLVTGLTMLKAVLDAGTCLTLAYDQAAERNAKDDCARRGGVVVGVEGEKTICEVHERVP